MYIYIYREREIHISIYIYVIYIYHFGQIVGSAFGSAWRPKILGPPSSTSFLPLSSVSRRYLRTCLYVFSILFSLSSFAVCYEFAFVFILVCCMLSVFCSSPPPLALSAAGLRGGYINVNNSDKIIITLLLLNISIIFPASR